MHSTWDMGRFEISGRRPVGGVHRVPGNTNAALPMLAAATLGALVWFFPGTPLLRGIATAIAVFVIVKHRSNIVRLLKGCENRIY